MSVLIKNDLTGLRRLSDSRKVYDAIHLSQLVIPEIIDEYDEFLLKLNEENYIEVYHKSKKFNDERKVAEFGILDKLSTSNIMDYFILRLKYVIWTEYLI